MKRMLLLLGIMLAFVARVGAQDDERFVGTFPAPEFAAGLDWINVEQPLTMAGLQGKIVIFDFWTYGCINCIHMIPVYEQLEAKYPDEIVIIGVHSAKFANEGQTDNIRQIVRRYGITHPVINDKDFIVWQEYGINAWPTLVIIDPRGNVVAGDSGEIPFDILDTYVGGMIAYYDGLGNNEIDRTPLALALEGAGDPGTPLLFPGEVLADEKGNRLFIADSNHNRIIVADLTTYEVLDIIGGQRSQENGTFEEAGFNQPQGLALSGDLLYIADTNNHQIRVANLIERTVTTIAGNGLMSPTLAVFGQEADKLTERPLRSPWDLAFGDDDNTLYIAMAGMHQVHVMDIARGVQKAVVGTGAEGQVNGALEQSELAQPSGLFFANGNLYIADSESSTVRAANFVQNQVQVVSGVTDNSLFDFGDVDGLPGTSRLQHALGVAGTPDGTTVYIADTYNSRIKALDTATNETTTIFGLGGEGGYADGDATVAQFDEPGGMSYANGKLYIADTNNQAIRVLDLASSTVSTVVFPNVEVLITNKTVTVIGGNQASGNTVIAEAVAVSAGDHTLTLSLTLPDGYKINPLTDSVVEVSASDVAIVTSTPSTVKIEDTTIAIPFTLAAGSTDVTLDVSLFYCEADTESVCLIDMTTIMIPVTVSADALTTEWTIAHTVVLPEEYQ